MVSQSQAMSAGDLLVAQALKEHKGTLIFLHGLGDTGSGWFYELKQIQRTNPCLKIICPTAPVQPVTLNGGMPMTSWHDIVNLTDLSSQTFNGIEKTSQIVKDLINEESKILSTDRIILGGFSQGAAMSMFVGLQYPQKLAGIIALSGYLPSYDQFESKLVHESNKETPVLGCHGDRDNVVNPLAGKLAHETIKQFNPNASLTMFPGLTHSSSAAEMRQVTDFISKHLPCE